jgi:para-nitrobenzyl esterase
MSHPATLIMIALALSACTEAPPVSVAGERLSGEALERGVTVFRGVPFAEPPVGELRWQLPKSLQKKVAERDATRFAPACMQSPRILEWYRGLAETFGAKREVFADLDVSEDCLYLNIWTPDMKTEASLPVMVYIHGGSNNSGWSYEPNYHGHALAEQGVVVVSIAYRLGVFGFFSHPELDDANFGLWDQLAALEWVKKNIEKFGGDPDRITLFGESAGAQDVLALMSTKKARGLFHAAIMQSTAGFGLGRGYSPTLADEQERGLATARLFGFTGPESLQSLRNVPAVELLRAYEDQAKSYYHSPAIDGRLVTRSVWEAINDGGIADVPFIIGSNADEQYASTPATATSADVAEAIAQSEFLNSGAVVAALANETDPREALDRIYAAEHMLCPSQYLAAAQTLRNGNGWVYYFSRVREGEAGAEVRAYHGAELPYVFGTHDPWMTTTDTDWRLARQMMGYWINLARNGNPNATGFPQWPAFPGPEGPVMEFAAESQVAAAQEPLLCRTFREAVNSTAN